VTTVDVTIPESSDVVSEPLVESEALDMDAAPEVIASEEESVAQGN